MGAAMGALQMQSNGEVHQNRRQILGGNMNVYIEGDPVPFINGIFNRIFNIYH